MSRAFGHRLGEAVYCQRALALRNTTAYSSSLLPICLYRK